MKHRDFSFSAIFVFVILAHVGVIGWFVLGQSGCQSTGAVSRIRALTPEEETPAVQLNLTLADRVKAENAEGAGEKVPEDSLADDPESRLLLPKLPSDKSPAPDPEPVVKAVPRQDDAEKAREEARNEAILAQERKRQEEEREAVVKARERELEKELAVQTKRRQEAEAEAERQRKLHAQQQEKERLAKERELVETAQAERERANALAAKRKADQEAAAKQKKTREAELAREMARKEEEERSARVAREQAVADAARERAAEQAQREREQQIAERQRIEKAKVVGAASAPEVVKAKPLGSADGGGQGSDPLIVPAKPARGGGDAPLTVDMVSYRNTVEQMIRTRWTVPKGVAVETRPEVVLRINRAGKVVYSRLSESSGNSNLDRSAIDAVRIGSRLIPLPPGYDQNLYEVKVKFEID